MPPSLVNLIGGCGRSVSPLIAGQPFFRCHRCFGKQYGFDYACGIIFQPDKELDADTTLNPEALAATLALLTGQAAIESNHLPTNSAGSPTEHRPSIPAFDRSIHHAVWTLAWPSVITMLMQTVNSLMDVFFVGHLPNGAHALAATGIGGSIMFLLISLAAWEHRLEQPLWVARF